MPTSVAGQSTRDPRSTVAIRRAPAFQSPTRVHWQMWCATVTTGYLAGRDLEPNPLLENVLPHLFSHESVSRASPARHFKMRL